MERPESGNASEGRKTRRNAEDSRRKLRSGATISQPGSSVVRASMLPIYAVTAGLWHASAATLSAQPRTRAGEELMSLPMAAVQPKSRLGASDQSPDTPKSSGEPQCPKQLLHAMPAKLC